MSLRLNGGGKAYRLNTEIVKSPPNSSPTLSSHSSSSSSTLSESSNFPLAVSIRQPRTPRKRLNQTYHEAAALLSTAYPNLFSSKNIIKPCNFSIPPQRSSELLLPFQIIENSGILVHDQAIREKPNSLSEPQALSFCEKSVENHLQGCKEDFDAESLLDEEIEEGVDSIMGNLSMINHECHVFPQCEQIKLCYLSPPGLRFGGNFDLGLG